VVLALAGVAVGWVGARELTPFLRSMLYEVGALEISVFAGSAALLVVVAALAGLLPAFRAARLDPMVCLRYE